MYTPTITPVSADFSLITSPKASIIYTGLYNANGNFNSYIDTTVAGSGDMDNVNLRMGAIDGKYIKCRNNSDSMALYFYMPTTNCKNLVIKYGTESSSVGSGMLHQVFAYSVDSGTNWITSGSGLSKWQDSAWLVFNLVTVNVTDAAAFNNRKFVFRITFAGNTCVPTPRDPLNAKGNNRFDNISLDADIINTALGFGEIPVEHTFTLMPNPVTNTLNVLCNQGGEKTVSIYNIIGQKVYENSVAGPTFSVNTAAFSKGIYNIAVRDNNSGAVKTDKFAKE